MHTGCLKKNWVLANLVVADTVAVWKKSLCNFSQIQVKQQMQLWKLVQIVCVTTLWMSEFCFFDYIRELSIFVLFFSCVVLVLYSAMPPTPQSDRPQRVFLAMVFHKRRGTKVFLPQLLEVFAAQFLAMRAPRLNEISFMHKKFSLLGNINNVNSPWASKVFPKWLQQAEDSV